MEELLKIHYKNLKEKDLQEFEKLDLNSDPIKIKPIFHPVAFLVGWFYLIYRKLYVEGLSIVIISMLLFRVSPIIGLIANNLLAGFFYYFLYAQKFKKDLEKAGYPLTDKKKLAKLGGVSMGALILSILITILLFWPIALSYMQYLQTHQ